MVDLTFWEMEYYAQRRAIFERQMASEMKHFYERHLLNELRQFVAQAIEFMVVFGLRNPWKAKVGSPGMTWDTIQRIERENNAIDDLIRGEKHLGVWRGRTASITALRDVLAERNSWTPSECSDLIRLYGAISEAKGKESILHGTVVSKEFAARQNYARVDVAGKDAQGKPRAHVWVKGEKGGSRDRTEKGEGIQPVVPSHVRRGREAMLDGAGKTAGIQRWLLGNRSTIRKIDAVFGLPSGADISGTTADSMFFMQHVDEFYRETGTAGGISFGDDLLRVMQLLPLATLVSDAHHTFLESALVLTMASRKEEAPGEKNPYWGMAGRYSIGFYSTVISPLLSSNVGANVVRLRNILRSWEAWGQHFHVLCYFDMTAGRWKGWRIEGHEMARFRQFAATGLRFLTCFHGFPTYVTKENLRTLAHMQGVPTLIPA